MFASGFHASLAGIETTTSEPYMIASNFSQIVCFGSRYLILPLFALANAGVEITPAVWAVTSR
ncbi:Na+/H+ antiporter NhaA [Rhizobium leguminosarum]|uniref:Na+/H+ antiporter NhaA n=1 Tax=Rhizobium leguminosarum TaxID=384 RepID=UPI0034A0D3F6